MNRYSPSQPGHVRASDADRDRVFDVLREALAEGRLTPVEHTERVDAVYTAKTIGELAPITSDLPGGRAAPGHPAISVGVEGTDTITTIMSGAERTGRWVVAPRLVVNSVLGGVELDFREAVLAQREITVQLMCLLGGVRMVVPEGVRVENAAAAILGGAELGGAGAVDDPGAPTIRLTGMLLLGGVEVKVKRRKRRRSG
ncbi:DUF1707 SHOCT-like domain-containing protein [Allonocardiopsis opalescens]|uniref:Cell wall-active antibiotic response 4TMS protein YvqF n=1 Tax=Allonocardiopsis opalescens TaxID=1144618 RepID=A0A2T0Q6K8_9ACTN|nr:DUF1707 domain-containing protein [Allonocardiopsis opalescens]PRX99460.1 cell wall-active antibiotic response 4TMS protein YvqF [Allonocardiopsis opalescens]